MAEMNAAGFSATDLKAADICLADLRRHAVASPIRKMRAQHVVSPIRKLRDVALPISQMRTWASLIR